MPSNKRREVPDPDSTWHWGDVSPSTVIIISSQVSKVYSWRYPSSQTCAELDGTLELDGSDDELIPAE